MTGEPRSEQILAGDSPQELALEFRRLSEELVSTGDASAAQQRLVDLACEVTGCDWAAVTRWVVGRPPTTVASTGAVPRHVDRIQYESGEGPCLAAVARERATSIPDLETDERWPRFSAAAVAETPVRSALSFHLSDEPDRAALNLYSERPDALTEEAVTAGALFASHAAVLVAHADSAREAETLGRALTTSRQIGSAIGILMAVHHVDEQTAFRMLRAVSNRLNRKLNAVARDVNTTGHLPR